MSAPIKFKPVEKQPVKFKPVGVKVEVAKPEGVTEVKLPEVLPAGLRLILKGVKIHVDQITIKAAEEAER
jgi:hypothetical protein